MRVPRNEVIAGILLSTLTPAIASQTVRDSAGDRIVTHTGAAGTGPTMFSHIWGAARAANGDIIVSDEPARELRVFDCADSRRVCVR
jgi:hypothetical protein